MLASSDQRGILVCEARLECGYYFVMTYNNNNNNLNSKYC